MDSSLQSSQQGIYMLPIMLRGRNEAVGEFRMLNPLIKKTN